MDKWYTKKAVDYAFNVNYEDHPKEATDKAKLLLIDNIGCILGGSKSAIGQSITPTILAMGGAQEATLIGRGVKVPVVHAAFVNGTNANALDFDDTYLSDAIGHPGSSTIPVALAVGEHRNKSGKDIINAIIAAYEAGNRIGLSIQPTKERKQNVWGFGTWQTFCSVIAAAKLMDLSSTQFLNAFGVAGATAPLPCTQKWGWELAERPIHWVKEPTGWPCLIGALAAALAENGFIGNHYILDGSNGFWIMAGSDKCDYNKITAGLGSDYTILSDMSFKPYACCRWQHAALDCINSIKNHHQLNPGEIKEINIYSFSWVKTQEVYEMKSAVDAQFSIPFSAALVALGYKPGPGWYLEELINSEAVKALAKKVKVTMDPKLEKMYQEDGEQAARVEISTITGDCFKDFVQIPMGDPRNPLSDKMIVEKFEEQASFALDRQKTEQALKMIADFEKLEQVKELMEVIAG